MMQMMKQQWTIWMASLAVATGITAKPLSSVLEEGVDVVVSFHSLADTRAQWAQHPFAEVVNDPQLQEFFKPLLNAKEASEEESFSSVLEGEFGLSVDEVFELFPGQLAVSLHNLPDLLLQQAERPELVILAEYDGDPERLSELMQIQFERNAAKQKEQNPEIEHHMIEESFMGETLFLDETFDGENTYIEDGYALVDGIFILATPETRLRSVVEAIKEGPDAPLADHPAYLRSRERGGRGDLAVYVNLEAILTPLNEAMLSKSMESGAAMFGLSSSSLDAALSLDSMLAFYVDVDLLEDGLSSHSGLIYREKAGLLSLIAYTDEALPDARYVPEGIFSTSVTNFDFGLFLARFEQLLATASPTLPPLIDMQIQNMRTNTGVDLRASVLENFGGDLVSLSILPEETRGAGVMAQPEQVILVELRDAEALSRALEALKDLSPGVRELIETKEFAGETIHTVKATPDPNFPEAQANDVSYVITRSHFILNVGDVGLLQEVLTRMVDGGDGFWQQSSNEDLFERIAMPHAVSRSYVDLEKLVIPIFQSIVQTSQFAGEAAALDMERIPRNLAVPFHMITEMNEESDGLFGRTLIMERKASE